MVVSRASRLLLSAPTPRGTKSVGYKLLLSNAFIHYVGRGLYGLMPLGTRVVDKLVRLIENELDGIGAQKCVLPLLGPRKLWESASRWSQMGSELFQVRDHEMQEYCLQPTAEEMMTDLIAQLPSTKKSHFPLLVYQTTEKFRDEGSARFGLLRAREFLMNDMYSFHNDLKSAEETYQEVMNAYTRIFEDRLKLEIFKVRADSGVHGGRLSHEFHIRNPLEEDGINYCFDCSDGSWKGEALSCEGHRVEEISTVEIGHTFQLGTKYTEALEARFEEQPLEMCCYGIGVTRLLAAAVEALSPNEKALRVPRVVAPFDVAVIASKEHREKGKRFSKFVDDLAESVHEIHEDVLIDDRDWSIKNRLRATSNDQGIPRMVVVDKAATLPRPLFELWEAVPGEEELRCISKELPREGLMEALRGM